MRRKFDRDSAVHRPLRLADRGEDARTVFRAINRRLKEEGRRKRIGTRGPLNRRKLRVALEALELLGVKVKHRGFLAKRAQEILRDPSKRTAAQKKRATAAKQPQTGRPREAFAVNVPNQSSRNGVKPRLIVLHSTESTNTQGTGDLRAIASWFSNPASQASSHVCVDGEGLSCRMVPDDRKAWHCAAYNSVSLGVEQVGRAAQGAWPDAQLHQTARYIAYWSRKYGIPIVHSTQHGVCTHSDLGTAGGGHHDPGAAFPFQRVLSLAKSYH